MEYSHQSQIPTHRKASSTLIPTCTGYRDPSFRVLILPRYLGIQTAIIPLPSSRRITSSGFKRSADIPATSSRVSSTSSSCSSSFSNYSSTTKASSCSSESSLYIQSPSSSKRIPSPEEFQNIQEISEQKPTPKPSLDMLSNEYRDGESSSFQAVILKDDEDDLAICDLIQGVRKMSIES